MKKKEIIEKINSYGSVFAVRHFDEAFSTMDYSRFIQYLQTEHNYWKKIDENKGITDGYSESYRRVLSYYKSQPVSLSDEILSSASNLLQHLSSNDEDFGRVVVVRENGKISFTFNMCSSKDAANFKLRNVYIKYVKNHEDDVIKHITKLYKKEAQLTNYLNSDTSSNEFKAAMSFISMEQRKNIQSVRFENEMNNEKSLEIESNLDALKTREEDFEKDINEFTKDIKNKCENWITEQNSDADALKSRFHERMEQLESVYNEKLKLSEPVKYWDEQASKMASQYRRYIIASALLTMVILATGYILVDKTYSYAVTDSELSRIVPFSFVLIGIISLLIYLLRTTIKIMLSSKHLEIEYTHKARFTYFCSC